MDIAAILLTLALLITVGAYLYAPFTERRARRVTTEEHETSALMAERDRIINALQELDFDFKLGKIPEEEYPIQRTSLLQKGAEILKRLDDLPPLTPDLSLKGRGGSAEDRIEKAIAARGAAASTAEAELSDDDLESMIAARRKERKGKSAGFCPRCGKPLLVTDRFCPSCGNSLA